MEWACFAIEQFCTDNIGFQTHISCVGTRVASIAAPSAAVRATIFLRTHGQGLGCGLPFAAQAAVHIGARNDRADAATALEKELNGNGPRGDQERRVPQAG